MSSTSRKFKAIVLAAMLTLWAWNGAAAGHVVYLSAGNSPDCSTISYSGGNNGPFEVSNVSELQCMGNSSTSTSLNDSFELVSDIDANDTDLWNGGKGFRPIGNDSSRFNGTFDGNDSTITGLYVNRSRASANGTGLFGRIAFGGLVANVTLVDANVTNANDNVGALVGLNDGTVRNATASGTVSGNAAVGGLVGSNRGSGLVEVAYATANVTASGDRVGGLVGDNQGTVNRTYAVGYVDASGSNVGGLVGVTGGTTAGSYYDTNATGQTGSAAGITPLTTAEMTGIAPRTNMTAFDFAGTWDVRPEDYPVFASRRVAPTAVADAYATPEDRTLTVTAANGTLANDANPDGDSITAAVTSGPTNGTLTLFANGSFEYDPATDFDGSDSFTYETSDGTDGSDTATVRIDLTAVNDPPVASNDSYTTREDTTLTVTAANGTLANDTDVDDATLTASLVSGPTNGTLTLSGNGSFEYAPDAEFNGEDSFTYEASDGNLTDTATVTITVGAVDDPPVASNDSYVVTEDATLTVAAANGTLANDTDADGDALTATVVSGPTNGTLTLSGNGSFEYTPDADFDGSDSFTYEANDGSLTDTATVTIDVAAVDDLPVARNESYRTVENGTLSVAAPGVLGNDTDPDDALTAAVVSGPDHGTLALSSNGSVEYTPAPGYDGPDSFTYEADDGDDTDAATVSITVDDAGNITYTDLDVAPSLTVVGDVVTANATVTNAGDVRTTYNASFRVDGSVVAWHNGTLAGGNSTDVTFTTSFATVGTRNLTIDGLPAESVTATLGEATTDATDDDVMVNVSLAAPAGERLGEGSITVRAVQAPRVNGTQGAVTLVENGTIQPVAADRGSTLDGANDSIERVRLAVPLQEGPYRIAVAAESTGGTTLSSSDLGDGFAVDMAGASLAVLPDESGPQAGTNASMGVHAVDEHGNPLLFVDGNVDAEAGAISIAFSNESGTVSVTDRPASATTLVLANASGSAYARAPKFDVADDTAETITVEAFDTGTDRTLSGGSAQQRFTASVAAVSVTAARSTLAADGTTTLNVTFQLLDAGGDPVRRADDPVSFSIANQSAANVTRESGAGPYRTDSGGQVVLTLSATNAGYVVEVTGIATDAGVSDDTTFETVTGAIGAGSNFTVGGTSSDHGATVNTTETARMELVDDAGNPLSGVNVTVGANTTAIPTRTVTTNASGVATTTIDYPTTTTTVALSASASSGGTSLGAAIDERVNVTLTAGSAVALSIDGSDPLGVRTDVNETVAVAVVDAFGNTVESDSSTTVTLATSDASAVSIVSGTGEVSSLQRTASKGVATFTVDADVVNATATLSVTATGLTNDSRSVTTERPAIDTARSSIALAGSNPYTVGRTTNATVTLVGSDEAAIPGVAVRFGSNASGTTFGVGSVTTDAAGVAETAVTLPTNLSAGPVAVTAAASARGSTYNASTGATETARLVAGAPAALAFAGPNRTIAVGTTETVTVEVVDQYGNLNASASPTVTVASNDTSVATVDGSATETATGGTASFDVDVASDASGTARLTASNATLTDDALELSVGTPDGVGVSFAADRIAVANATGRSTTTATLQLVDPGGAPIALGGETITLFPDAGVGVNTTTVVTNASGQAVVRVTGRSAGDAVGLTARSENYTASGSATVTVTDPAAAIRVDPTRTYADTGERTRVDLAYVDSAGRVVPTTEEIVVGTDLGQFLATNGSSVRVAPTAGAGYTANVSLTVSSTGTARLRAQNSSATVSGGDRVIYQKPFALSNASAVVDEAAGQVTLRYDLQGSQRVGAFYKIFPANPPEYAAAPGFFSGPTVSSVPGPVSRTVPLSGPVDGSVNNASLQAGERYVFEAYVNNANTSEFTTVLSRFTTPSGPLGVELSGSAANDSAVTLTANVTGFNGTDTAGSYYSYRAVNGSNATFVGGPTWDLPDRRKTTTLTGLQASTTYRVTITVRNGEGDVARKTVEVTTPAAGS